METNMADGGDVRALLNMFNKQAESSGPLEPPGPGPKARAQPGTPHGIAANGHLRLKLMPMIQPHPPGAGALPHREPVRMPMVQPHPPGAGALPHREPVRMPMVQPHPPGAGALPHREPVRMPMVQPQGHPGTPRQQLPPLRAGVLRSPIQPPLSPRTGQAAPQGLDAGRVRMTEELLQNALLHRTATPTPPQAGGSPQQPTGRGRAAEVTPLRRALPAEGRRPVKPKRPPQVNLEPYLRSQRPSLPLPAPPGLKKNNGSPTTRHLPRIPPGGPRGALAPKPHHQEAAISNLNRRGAKETYDDVDGRQNNDWLNDGSLQNNNVESDDSEVYESINEDEPEVPPLAPPQPKPQKEQKKQPEPDKKGRKEQEKREKELRKKFQLKGALEVLHTAQVRRDWSGGKLDLVVSQGERVDILRVKDNPGGKWLVRSQTGKWGYVNIDCVDVDYEEVRSEVQKRRQTTTLPPPPPDPPQTRGGLSSVMESSSHPDFEEDDDDYDDVQIPDDFPPPPDCSFDPSVARELKKRFKFEGPLHILHTMMVDPSGVIQRPKEKELAVAQGEILDVLQFSSNKMALCRNHAGKFGLVPRSLLLQMEGDIYDDIDHLNDVYDNDTLQ